MQNSKKLHLLLILSLFWTSLPSVGCDGAKNPVCGDEFVDPAEECDGAELGGLSCATLGHYNTVGVLGCNEDCSFDRSDCGGRCGDGVIHLEHAEECDADNLGGETCESLGFSGGILWCGSDCLFDTTDCDSLCGNGVADPSEPCDGFDVRAMNCLGLGFSGGILRCTQTCQFDETECQSICGNGVLESDEACEGANTRGLTCEGLGFEPGGQLACVACDLDLTGCLGTTSCGDGVIDEGEECDGTEFGGASCMTLGFSGGLLACGLDCRYKLSRCMGSTCGNGTIETGEQYDGIDLGGATCATTGFSSGVLGCTSGCQLNTAGCGTTTRCGDGLAAPSEECDGADLKGQTCEALGFDSGTLWCEADCRLSTGNCACNVTCTLDDQRCDNDRIQICEQGDGACLLWRTTADCRTQGKQCSFDGTTASCQDLKLWKIAGGTSFTCALDVFGNAWCWGMDVLGNLGEPSSMVPVAVNMPSNRTFSQLSTGISHACALDDLGTAWCWGWNSQGQLGDGSTTFRKTPVAVLMPPGRRFIQISAGSEHTCAVDDAVGVWCWGSNTYGQLGDGTQTRRLSPVQVSAVAATQAAAAYHHTCMLDLLGNAWCWGANQFGQLGDGTTQFSTVPTASDMPESVSFSSLALGPERSCGIDTAGSAWCWGLNQGVLGTGVTEDHLVPTAVVMPDGRTFTSMSWGNNHVCALDQMGQAWCWGDGNWGVLGNGTFDIATSPTTVLMPGGRLFEHLVAGTYHSCAVDDLGGGWCWGQGMMFQLGDGIGSDQMLPVSVVFPPPAANELIVDGTTVQLGGDHQYDVIRVINGGTIRVRPFNGTDKSGTGNLRLIANLIYVDSTSIIDATGTGYQPTLCDHGPGPYPSAGGRGGCAVRDGGGGGAHFGAGGRGTKACPGGICTFPMDWEEECGTYDGGTICTTISGCENGDALPSTAGISFAHGIHVSEFGAAGGDAGCRDGDGFMAPQCVVGGAGGGRIMLAAISPDGNGLLEIHGQVIADGKRGCAIKNDVGGGGAGGTIIFMGDRIVIGESGVIRAAGGRGGDKQAYAVGECSACAQSSGTCDQCGGGGGGGLISFQSPQSAEIHSSASLSVDGGDGGLCSCSMDAAGFDGLIQF